MYRLLVVGVGWEQSQVSAKLMHTPSNTLGFPKFDPIYRKAPARCYDPDESLESAMISENLRMHLTG